MMNERKTLREFRHELNLSRDKHLIVEGYTDRNFYTAWLDSQDSLDGISVQVVGAIEVDNGLVSELGLPDAERSRVIALASETQDFREKVLCVADRDTGVGVEEFRYLTLVWTDFPALESYVMHPKLFRIAHRICLQGRIKNASTLHAELSEALLKLWRVRIGHPNLKMPNYKKGLKNGVGLEEFNVFAAVDAEAPVAVDSSKAEDLGDIRRVAYGHDISGLLFAAYAGQIKNTLHLASKEALERSLCAAIVNAPEMAEEHLFVRMRSWASGECSGVV